MVLFMVKKLLIMDDKETLYNFLSYNFKKPESKNENN